MPDIFLVVTTINHPTQCMLKLSEGCRKAGFRFIVAGDAKSPADFRLEGCKYLSMEAQVQSGFRYAALCPANHYVRKNLGYLEAIWQGAELIIETDDDNVPTEAFFAPRARTVSAPVAEEGWVNVYRYFTENPLWPRGLALEEVQRQLADYDALPAKTLDCPIQQGLVDGEPDVDAIYRFVLPMPQYFRKDRRVALEQGSWCPFNSQNTSWWPEAYPLLYLPATCTFRLTDIWRSFVAQRIAFANGWGVLFHEPTVVHERNVHNIMKDFSEEVQGYLHSARIAETLSALAIRPGREHIAQGMRDCYRALVGLGIIREEELTLLDAWLDDLKTCA